MIKKLNASIVSVVFCAVLALAVSGTATAQLKPAYLDSQIKLDGFLSESAWQNAEPITGFTQQELVEGDPASEKTEVRMLFDDDTLYIGVMCYDNDPSGIIARQLRWDGDMDGDDNFALVIDTYNDKRTGFRFAVNPNGAQMDGAVTSGNILNSIVNTEWDAIWEARSAITAEGWSVEIAIPFKSLRFPTTDIQTWGINFRRIIRRKNEIALWRGWKRNQGLLLLSQAGTLQIAKQVKEGKQINVKPYVLGGFEEEHNTAKDNIVTRSDKDIDDITKVGLDVKYNITSNMTLDLTTNTDFAHIESDREVINLSRFDIYYPEKREFFLEGSDTFDFTQGGTRLFYSRRIGITPDPDRQDQRIIGGAKLTQKAGSYRLGVLTMQTEDKSGYPGANYSIIRAKKDVLEQSYIGFLATNKVDNDKHDNQIYGLDWILRTDKFLGDRNLDVQGYLSGSVTDGKMHESSAGRLYISYPNEFVDSFILYHALDEQFNPEMGFARVVGIKNYIWFTTIKPRPDIPFIKRLVLKPFNFNYTTDMDGVLLFRDVEIRPLGFETDSDDEFSFSVWNDYDYVYETDFSIFGYDINPGIYDNWYYDMQFRGSRRRNVAVDMSARWGDFFSGTRNTFSTAVTYKSGSHYSFTADAGYTKMNLVGKDIIAREYGTRIGIDISTRLSTSTFIQYNNETREINTNFRLRFIPTAGSDLYLVYNHLGYHDNREDEFITLRNAAMLKLDYIYRF